MAEEHVPTHPGLRERFALARRLWAISLPVALIGWWALVWFVPETIPWFMPTQMPASALWAFGLPDVVCTLAGCGLLLFTGTEDNPKLWWFLAGAHLYSGLWVLTATLLTGEALAGTVLMMLTAFVTLNLAWTDQPQAGWFRSSSSSPLVNGLKTIVHALIFDGLFLVLLPVLILWLERDLGVPALPTQGSFWWMVGCIVPLNLMGLGCGLWMVRHGDGTPLPTDMAVKLVVSGPYRWLRNPMASVGILQGVLLGIGLASAGVIVYAIMGAVVWHVFVRPIEEADLLARFGPSYARYHSEVGLWLPRPPRS